MNSTKYLSHSGQPMYFDCIACGTKNPMGLKLKFFTKDSGVKTVFTPDEMHTGYKNIVHGGIISTLLDAAIIWASYAETGCFGMTAELTVRFCKPLPTGKECFVEGKIIKDRRKLLIAESRIVDEEEELYATAMGKIVPMNQK